MSTPIRARSPTFLALAAILLAAACGETRYTDYQAERKEDASDLVTRSVEYELTGDYYRDFPECAIVAPFRVDGRPHAQSALIEDALARHLGDRLERVIGPRDRARIERENGLDLANPKDRAAFARQARCRFVVEATPWGGEDIYAVFWTQSRLGLEIRMSRAADGGLLWRARHVATRSEGGVPLSPIGALFNIVTAASFKNDRDVDDSLADDAMRRMLKTLPDSRSQAGGRLTLR